MPQDHDSNRHASLDDKKERAAGRMDEAKRPFQRHTDEYAEHDAHAAGGAFGKGEEGLTLGKGDERGSNLSHGGGGGGGGGPTTAKDEQSA